MLKVGHPPAYRVGGQLRYAQTEQVTAEQTRAVAELLLRHAEYTGSVDDVRQFDCAYGAPELGRFRVGIYRQRRTLAIALRAIPLEIPSFEELGLPDVVRTASDLERGLVLVVGAAGNGKTTTLASMVDHMNHTRPVHIVTIEDPIEYLHEDDVASVSQREVGPDTDSFASALRATLRHSPDVILVGEIRDEVTMDIALKASETGHLVLSTLHTPDVERTVGRVLSLVPGDDVGEARARFADNVKAIFAQRLLPSADGAGRALALEVLVGTGTARESLRNPAHNPPLKEIMERGVHPYGMQTFEMSVRELLQQGRLSQEIARAAIR